MIIYWKLREEALDCTVGRTCLGRGYGPVSRQTVIVVVVVVVVVVIIIIIIIIMDGCM
jgi:hypothetical protein